MLFGYFRVTGLQCIIVSDREGVPLLKIAKDNKTPELGTRQNFLSSFSQTSLQAGKIGLGKNQAVISSYTNYQVILCIFDYQVI